MNKIKKGQRVRLKPEWLEEGEEDILWIAVEDEDGPRITLEARMNLPINPQERIDVDMIAR